MHFEQQVLKQLGRLVELEESRLNVATEVGRSIGRIATRIDELADLVVASDILQPAKTLGMVAGKPRAEKEPGNDPAERQ